MTEFVDRMNLDELVFEDEIARHSSPFTPGKLFGVAFLGALTALSAYYVYNELDPERRAQIRQGVVSFVTSQVGCPVNSAEQDGQAPRS